MPHLKCPGCKEKGSTGPVGNTGTDIEVAPGNVEGSTKSMLRCARCGTVFLRGPLSSARIVKSSAWPYPTGRSQRATEATVMRNKGVFSSEAPTETMVSLDAAMIQVLDEAWSELESARLEEDSDYTPYERWSESAKQELQSLAVVTTDLAARRMASDTSTEGAQLTSLLASCLRDKDAFFEHTFAYFNPTQEKMESLEATLDRQGSALAAQLERMGAGAE